MVKQAGLLLDVARKFHSAADIRELIGQVKAAGGAYIQLHLSDDENYALESALLGQTADESSKDAAGNYFNRATQKPFLSRAQVRELAVYAQSQGIELIPEVGSPAHMGVLFKLYGIKYGQQALEGFENPYKELRYTTDSAIEFVQRIYREVIDFFGNVRRFHLGGDEHGASYNEQYNHEFVAYANRQAAYIKGLGITPRMWNDGILKSSVNDFDKAIEVTYWSWDGDKPNERERLIGIRASMPDIIRAGHKVINCNSYFTYSAPKGALEQVSHDARYAADDASKRWDLSVWDGQNIPGTEPADPDKVAGAMMSIWCEDISAEQTSAQIRNALQPHFAAIFKIVNAYNNVNAGVPMSNNPIIMHKPVSRLPDVLEPNAVYFLRVGEGIDICVTDMTGQVAHRHNKGVGAALSPEQAAALQRFTAQVGTGATMTLANVTDVAQTNVGALVDTLQIASYSDNSGMGGGMFRKVSASVPLRHGIVIVSKDGHRFQRQADSGRYDLHMFGYLPGSTNDNAVFRQALSSVAAVKGRLLLPRDGTIYVDGTPGVVNGISHDLPVGIKEIDGQNCTIVMIGAGNNDFQIPAGSEGLEIHHLTIMPKASGVARCGGFYGKSVRDIHIHHCVFRSKANHSILNRIHKGYGATISEGWHVHDNISIVDREVPSADFSSSQGAYQNILMDLDRISDTQSSNNMDTLWPILRAVPDAHGRRHRNHKIYNNICIGGRYGISIYYGQGCHVYSNYTENNVRGIVFQDKPFFNHVHHNHINDYTTGILFGYEAVHNMIEHNILRRRAGWHFAKNGQAHILLNVSPSHNTVKNNKCYCDDDGSPAWGIYCGLNAVANIVEGNELHGRLGRAAIVLESSWGGTADNLITYNIYNNPNWGKGDCVDNIFRGNVLNISSPVPGIVLCSRNDGSVPRRILGTVVSGQIFLQPSANTQYVRMITQDDNGISGTVMRGNRYPAGSTSDKFMMGAASMYAQIQPEVNRPSLAFETGDRGVAGGGDIAAINAKLAVLERLALNQGTSSNLSDDGVLAVTQLYGTYALRGISAEEPNKILKRITGGVFGQEITIQFQNGYQVEHSDFLRLQPAQSLTSGLNGNSFIRFKCIDPTQQKWVQLKY